MIERRVCPNCMKDMPAERFETVLMSNGRRACYCHVCAPFKRRRVPPVLMPRRVAEVRA